MSARGMLSVVGTAVGGLIGWNDSTPSADPATLRALFADMGVMIGPDEAQLTEAVRYFQSRAGLDADGEAGPETVHLLVRYAAGARETHLFQAA
ncbi:peptidoglycan-binding protein [Actinoplanes sp. CA-015351]|uniref:peptidoglycan-binding protein n=1 Tax=Actinoplanes sp. CA-015351 TaxID=3239897 RepID=UPI003D978BEE